MPKRINVSGQQSSMPANSQKKALMSPQHHLGSSSLAQIIKPDSDQASKSKTNLQNYKEQRNTSDDTLASNPWEYGKLKTPQH